MRAAMDAVSKGMSVKRAAAEHVVLRLTLHDQKQGNVVHGINPGPKPYLDEGEEEELREFIMTVGQIGFGKTRKQIKSIAEKYAVKKDVLRNDKVTLFVNPNIFHYTSFVYVHTYAVSRST